MKKKLLKYPRRICTSCGLFYGHKPHWPSTYHMAPCGVCNESKMVTEPRDFGFPDFPGHENINR